MPEKPKFYLTTPIYYVNARPHIGHAYTTIAADVIARRHRLLGDDTFFLTGTDEHGQKIERSAAAAGIPPQQFTDQVAASFRGLWDRMGITYNDFIRTTEPRHAAGVQKLFTELYNRGHIYLSTYTGAYCVSDEAFVDAPVGTPCPDCGRILEEVTEENFFFRLSVFQESLIDLIESGTLAIQPDVRRNEVLSFVKGGLKDLSISRSSFKWGIPVPGEVQQKAGATQIHIVYVWLDALTNYMSAVGYGSDAPADIAQFEKFWPADLHLVGKEIIRFHCVYWPAFLIGLNSHWEADSSDPQKGKLVLEPDATKLVPKAITAHGWLLFEESKMSKSRGNIVRTETILDAFGDHYRESLVKASHPEPTKADCDLWAADVLRYFLLREIPFGQDGSFSFDALITRYNADLANGYGNLVSRTLSMIDKYFDGVIPQAKMTQAGGVYESITAFVQTAGEHFKQNELSRSVIVISSMVALMDAFITSQAPWKLAADQNKNDDLKEVLYIAAESIRTITALLYPVLPHTTAQVWAQLGLGSIEEAAARGDLKDLQWGGLKPGTKLGPLAPIFPRAPKELAQTMSDIEAASHPAKPTTPEPTQESVPSVSSVLSSSPAEPATSEPTQISIDDFVKIDLRVAQILVAERIPKADKLLRLEVDLGYEKRQILSGIAQHYTPEELIGRRIAIIANLAPRKMRGLDSHGMLLAASDDKDPNSKPILASFSNDVPLGSRIR